MLLKLRMKMLLACLGAIAAWLVIFKYIILAVSPVDESVAYWITAVIIIIFIYYYNSLTNKNMTTFIYIIHLLFSIFCLVIGIIALNYLQRPFMWGMLLIAWSGVHFMWASADNAGSLLKNLLFTLILFIFGCIMYFNMLLSDVGFALMLVGNLLYFGLIDKFKVSNKKLFRIMTPTLLLMTAALTLIGLFVSWY